VDFQFDATTDGRPIKIVSIVDEHTRECLGGLVERCVTADVLTNELDRLAVTRGYPKVLRCDNGPELACTAMADRAGERVGLSFIPPGEPWRNGYVESFNARVRDECLRPELRGQMRATQPTWAADVRATARAPRPKPGRAGLIEPARELLAVVGQHLLRDPEALQRLSNAKHTARPVARRTTVAMTQSREWSSTP
jgi:hypothetical protein